MSILSFFKDFFYRYKENRLAVIGVIIIVFFFALVPLTPLIARNPFELTKDTLKVPCWEHPFGTDDIGRDIFSMVIYGARASLLIGVLVGMNAMLIGMTIGAIAGYYGGKVDMILMRVTEVFQTIPSFIIAIVLVVLLGPNVWNVIYALSVVSWVECARIMRAEYLSQRELEYVYAAEALGMSSLRIAFIEILPNAWAPVIAYTTIVMSKAIIMESGLSFLGCGDPAVISWGFMLSLGKAFINYAWWMSVFPGLMIFTVSLGLNMVGSGLGEALSLRKG